MKKITFTASFVCLLGCAALLTSPAHAQTPTQAADLSGNWKLVGWTLPANIPVKGHLPTLTFKAGQVSGNAGCNRLNGKYTLSGDTIAFGPLATTRMACEPDVNEQEQTFLGALSGKTLSVTRSADSLTLTTGDGYMLNIRRSTLQEAPAKK